MTELFADKTFAIALTFGFLYGCIWLDRVDSQTVDKRCLTCLCNGFNKKGCADMSCRSFGGVEQCGPYQITLPYYTDCGELLGPTVGDFQRCAQDLACAADCVSNYMSLYALNCTGGRPPTCEDFSKIHRAGPWGCTQSWNELNGFWNDVKKCYLGERSQEYDE